MSRSRRIAQARYRLKNREKLKEYSKRYCAENPAIRKASQERYREANLEDIRFKGNLFARTVKGRYRQLKQSSKMRGIELQLTFEQYAVIISNASCTYCEGSLPETGAGLDRIDSVVGYTLTNVVPCCTICNTMFNKYSKEFAIEHMRKILTIYIADKLKNEVRK